MTSLALLDRRRLSLTDARAMFGLSARALRYYEERGLVRAERDGTNARWYDAVARRRLAWIAKLRHAVPLDEIAEIIRADEAEPGQGRVVALGRIQLRRVSLEDELARIYAIANEMSAEGPYGARSEGPFSEVA